VESGKVARLLHGFRGAPAADVRSVVDLLLRVSRLVDDVPELAELDLNPVLALPHGCVTVDARVRLRARPRARSPKSW